MVPRVGGMAVQEGNLRLEALILVKCSCDGGIFLVRSSFLGCHHFGAGLSPLSFANNFSSKTLVGPARLGRDRRTSPVLMVSFAQRGEVFGKFSISGLALSE